MDPTTLPPEARSLAGWTPLRFFWQEGRPVVEWCQLGARRLSAPFYAQTAQAARAAGCPTRLTPAEALDEFADATPDLPLAGLIFHLSRCGSTLVSRMLGALPAHVVLSEPETLEGVWQAAAWSPGVDDETRARWLRGLIHAHGARRFPEERRLVVKLDPWHILDAEVIRRACPGVPCVYVYREPVEILVSLNDHMASTFAPTPAGATRMGLTFVEALSLGNDAYCARALGRLAEEAARTADADPAAWRLVNYRQLPEAVETLIAPHFGLRLDGAEQEAMRGVARFHAKAPGALVFQADAARKQREADEELRALAARWIAPAYAALERVRTARP